MSSRAIFALRKQQRSTEALALARQEFPEHKEDIWFLRAYAWSLYDHVKSIVQHYESKQLSPTSMASQFTPYMREFCRMARPLRGDTAFSQMLRLAGKVSRDWPMFLGFAQWVGTDGFSDEDKQPFVNDQGKTLDSLHKRFIRAVCRETVHNAINHQIKPEWMVWGRTVLEQALETDPDDQWLNYYQSKWYLTQGEQDLAVRHLLPIVRRQLKAAWPWALLGEILEKSRPDDALTCYAYACQLSRDEQEVAKVRIHLAQRLALAQRFNEAAQQAHQALQYREHHQFRVPQALQQLLASDWYRQAISDNTLQAMPQMDSAAKTLLQEFNRQNLTFTLGVVDHINADKKLSYVATGHNSGIRMLHKKFKEIKEISVGTVLEIGHNNSSDEPLDWRVSETQSIPALFEAFSGSLVRPEGKAFAFIRSSPLGDIFVGSDMAQTFTAGQPYAVYGTAIRRTNKHGKTGWRAVQCSQDFHDG